MKYFICTLLISIGFCSAVFSGAEYTLVIRLTKHPDSKVYLASLKGDAYKIIDTAELKNDECVFTFGRMAQTGMYRIIPGASLGHTRRNAVLNTIDIIFNHEDICIETVYPWLNDSLVILESVENKTYAAFLNKEGQLQNKMDLLRAMLDQYPSDDELYGSIAKRYNDLQKEKQNLIQQTCDTHAGSFAAAIIEMHKTPFLDAGLSEKERLAYYRQHYFDELDYGNRDLIYSGAYTHNVIRYLMLYRDPALDKAELEKEFMKATDVVLAHANRDPEVYAFILNYLMEGFERLQLDNVLKYVADQYMGTVCTADNGSTLLRRMESYSRLAVGMQAEDIIIPDARQQEIRLSAIEKPYILVVFWASWCPGCEELMPKLEQWYLSNSAKFGILAVSLDSVRVQWMEAIERGRYSFLNGCDLKSWEGKAAGDYSVYATPSLFLLDHSRKIIDKPLTYEAFVKAAESLSNSPK